jgi:hypothetical protein
VWLLSWLFLLRPALAADACEAARPGEPVRVYLLTTAPGDDLTSLMGHSALWVSGGNASRSTVYNWGAFDSRQDAVVMRFLHGTLDFWLDSEKYSSMEKRVKRERRTLYAQRLDLEDRAADQLARELQAGAAPEVRNYPYQWVERNCASQVRDVLDEATGGALKAAAASSPLSTTARREVLRHFAQMPPVWFGWNLLAGPYTDQPLDAYGSLFIPERLFRLVDGVQVRDALGATRPLVSARCTLLEGETEFAPAEPPGNLGLLWGLGLGLGGLIVGLGAWPERAAARRLQGGLVIGVGLALGGLGCGMLVVWLISTLSGVGPNPIYLLGSPLSLIGLLGGGRALWRGERASARPWQRVLLGALGLAALGALLCLYWGTDLLGAYGLFLPPLVGALFSVSRVSAHQSRSPNVSR